jgi:hypothetical protein
MDKSEVQSYVDGVHFLFFMVNDNFFSSYDLAWILYKFASIHVRIKPKTVGIRWYQRGNKNPYIEDEQTTQ